MKNLIRLVFLSFMLLQVFSLQAQFDPAFSSTISHRRGSLGLGYGLCYGGLGFNGDFNFTDDLAVSGSIGTFGYVGGYELGIKYFFLDFDAALRPKLSAWYGVNAIVYARPAETMGLPKVTEAHKGFCLGAGGEWMFGSKHKHGLDFDLLYMAHSSQAKRIKELEAQGYPPFAKGNPLLFSFGYRYIF